ncbi:MAG: M3 family metallopeptidase [Saprospiraceae bacterium]|jgi:peptidyl-dipeptidase Dcp|uniref:M3 family metallopeptidase n=1 Tax=Candidatus Brachybacter algidus TaxID=2982024 RepID=UPI001B61334F|nr:M3 family metallopeptidase [Candidatus Brachybacter algidus]MBP7305281.1 M3 family metallopeptidase [Saprospiraceae bacterium]MBK6449252.1 M3 family metallopeptidase [Candidatus Brachybacter algidus]MBK8605239.1 M3 family metallopeptidase [Candidatus Brachybacter algidus]MBP7540624.1 M3 family metallopeptidase [Saprospiraceae bacterium]MBP8892579.1 M3 family metallopeptidase [Saprospiraceae bacterium]
MFKTLSLLSVFTIFGFFFNDIYMNQNNLIPTTFVSSENVSEDQNPLLQPWSGNYGGYPAFDKVKIKDFLPAFEVAMKEGLNEIEKIANNPAPPTFENTMLELEKSGHSISRLIAIYGVWSSTMNSDEFQNVETIIEPKLSEYSDKIAQNSKLFKRIEKIYNSEEYKTLSLEAQRLTYLKYSGLVRNGARLNETDKAKLSNYNQALAALYTKFSQNLLSDENDKIVVIENKTDLKGLSKDLVDAAASAGVGVNKGKWVINNTRSSVDPFLTYAENRDLREKVWRMFISRGDNGDKNDNNSTIVEILKIRALRAKLLGFKTHADWRLDNSMAKTPENAMKLMMDVWKPAILKVKEEVADMQAIADKEGNNIKIEPWDYRYYAEKVRLAKYDLDQNQVKEYLQLDKLKEGMFWVAGQIFNMSFSKLENIPVYHPDVEVWEVKNKLTGKHIGLWYFDPYARAGKRSGAWMNAFRDQERVSGDIPTIVSNNANFVKGRPGEPVLISWDDASTLFHEFGHALHGLSSRVIYPTLSGTNVFTDYVEFPSQLLEYWLSTPEVLQNYALHYKTGNPIPEELVKKIHAASTFNEGFATTEYLSSALIDMKLHLAEVPTTDPDKFEKETLESLGMPKEIVMRHRTPQFGHIFSSDQYSAGYYSYLWADVLTADAYQAFIEGKGPYDESVAKSLTDNVFSVGNTIDPADGYKQFRGREPKTEALMKKRGLN